MMNLSRTLFPAAILFALILPQTSLQATEYDSTFVVPSSTLRTIKWAPLAMLDIAPAAQFAYEYPIGPNRSIQHEIGFISHTVNPIHLMVNYEELTGIRVRNELRFYNNQNKGYGDFYLAPEFTYTYYKSKSQEWFNRFDGAYRQQFDYEGNKHMAAAHMKLGVVYPSTQIPISWDFFLGFGLKYRYVNSNLPDDATPDGPSGSPTIDSWFYPDHGSSLRFSITAGIRLGYILP